MIKVILTILSLAILSSCASILPGMVTEEVRIERALDKAAWDLECSKEKINIIKINETTYGASGCNKRASYVMKMCRSSFMVTDYASSCTAELNSIKKSNSM